MPKVASYSSSDHKQTVDRANGHLFLSFALYRPYGARALQGIHNVSPLLYHTYQDYTDCYKLRWMHTHTHFLLLAVHFVLLYLLMYAHILYIFAIHISSLLFSYHVFCFMAFDRMLLLICRCP